NLVGDVLDRAYALDFPAGSNHAEVEVELAVKPKSLNQYLRVEAVEGCAAGWRAKRAIEVFAERSVWFPPRACIAPTGPFVAGDHATFSIMLHPPAPEGGA